MFWRGFSFRYMGYCVLVMFFLEEFWGNVSIWDEKGGDKEGIFCVLGLKECVGFSLGKR